MTSLVISSMSHGGVGRLRKVVIGVWSESPKPETMTTTRPALFSKSRPLILSITLPSR
jgi:hypothetical protein